MATAGTRGKWAEGRVRDWMKLREERDARFAFARWPDARAGSAQTAPSDFVASYRGAHFKIEVKEVKISTIASRRLPEKNFSADKRARMHKWQLAGDQAWVIVCHLEEGRSGRKEWRLVPLERFLVQQASWDLGDIQPHERVEEVMLALFGSVRSIG